MSSGSDRRPLTVAIHQPECLPWLGFVDKLRQCDLFVLLDSVQFEKNYFQNRNRVRAASGAVWLTIPVLTHGRFGQTIRDVGISPGDRWRRKHWVTVQQAYGSAPCFPQYCAGLEALYRQPWERLVDFNITAIKWLADAFGVARPFVLSSELRTQGTRSELLANICRLVGATEYLSGTSGREYLEESYFSRAGIGVRYQAFCHPAYRQCYEPFMPMMSSIDLLFNAGANSLRIVAKANTAEHHAKP